MDPEQERRLIARLRRRDERAFNELVELFEGRVFRIALRMLGRRADAEEVANEVFVQVFKSIDAFREEARLGTWLCRIAVNLSKNRVRYHARRSDLAHGEYEGQRVEESAQGVGVTVGETTRPDHLIEGLELQRLVEQCVSEIPEEYREVLILRDVENLEYEEIAEITGAPFGTIKSRLHRGRAALKRKLELRLGEKLG